MSSGEGNNKKWDFDGLFNGKASDGSDSTFGEVIKTASQALRYTRWRGEIQLMAASDDETLFTGKQPLGDGEYLDAELPHIKSIAGGKPKKLTKEELDSLGIRVDEVDEYFSEIIFCQPCGPQNRKTSSNQENGGEEFGNDEPLPE